MRLKLCTELVVLDEHPNDGCLQSNGLEFWTKWALHTTRLFLLLVSGSSLAWLCCLCLQQQGVPLQPISGSLTFPKKFILIQVFCSERKASGRQCCDAVLLLLVAVVHKEAKVCFLFQMPDAPKAVH